MAIPQKPRPAVPKVAEIDGWHAAYYRGKNHLAIPRGTFRQLIQAIHSASTSGQSFAVVARQFPGIKPQRINLIAQNFGYATGDAAVTKRALAKRTETRDPSLKPIFLDLMRNGVGVEDAVTHVGVDFRIANRWLLDLPRAERGKLRYKKAAISNTHPLAGLMRKMLAVKDEHGQFKYSFKAIASLFLVDKGAVIRANEFGAEVRSPKDRELVTKKLTANVGRVASRAKAGIDADFFKILDAEKSACTVAKLASLPVHKKLILSRRILKYASVVVAAEEKLRNGGLEITTAEEKAKVLSAIFRSPNYTIEKDNLVKAVSMPPAKISEVISAFRSSKFVGLISISNSRISINPESLILIGFLEGQ